MDNQANPDSAQEKTFRFNLGTFEGFNFRTQSAIRRRLTTAAVVAWDHDRQGEAEFWPSGDHSGVRTLFNHKTAVTAGELLALDHLLTELRGDSLEDFMRIYYAVNVRGANLAGLSAEEVENNSPHIFLGTCLTQLRFEAAYELFELYYPEVYRVYDEGACDGLVFDTDRFLDSPRFSVEEVELGEQKALLVDPQ